MTITIVAITPIIGKSHAKTVFKTDLDSQFGLVYLTAKHTLTRPISTPPSALGKGDIVAGSGKKGVSVVVVETEAEVGGNDVVEDGESDDSDIFTFKCQDCCRVYF